MEKIEILQKKAIRLIDKAFFLEHTEKLFKKYDLLKVSDIFKHKCLVFFFRIINRILPTNLCEIISNYDENYNCYSCRLKYNFYR